MYTPSGDQLPVRMNTDNGYGLQIILPSNLFVDTVAQVRPGSGAWRLVCVCVCQFPLHVLAWYSFLCGRQACSNRWAVGSQSADDASFAHLALQELVTRLRCMRTPVHRPLTMPLQRGAHAHHGAADPTVCMCTAAHKAACVPPGSPRSLYTTAQRIKNLDPVGTQMVRRSPQIVSFGEERAFALNVVGIKGAYALIVVAEELFPACTPNGAGPTVCTTLKRLSHGSQGPGMGPEPTCRPLSRGSKCPRMDPEPTGR